MDPFTDTCMNILRPLEWGGGGAGEGAGEGAGKTVPIAF